MRRRRSASGQVGNQGPPDAYNRIDYERLDQLNRRSRPEVVYRVND